MARTEVILREGRERGRGAPEGDAMLALLRLVIIGFVVLTAIYVALSIWSRRVRRGKLGLEWDEAQGPGAREAFVEEGLRDYDRSLRRKLILGVYVVPVCVVALIVYLTNYH
ncbi:hypothetical protein [Salipiger sp.]|uniref:hypothetical protein n=1 Tax=Salipiger sp. TaxID=2078585 RepID=UPI003A978302